MRINNWKAEAISLTTVMDRNRTARKRLLEQFNKGVITWDTLAKCILALDESLNNSYVHWLCQVKVIVGPESDHVEPQDLTSINLN
jgi:hypothetical protein